jgi:hypothetical protein
MESQSDASRNITKIALVVEGGLAVAAAIVAWVLGRLSELVARLAAPSWDALVWDASIGVAATAPLLVVMLVIDRCPVAPLQRLVRAVDDLLVPLFSQTTVLQMAAISLTAGVGEEMFFRGLLQAAISDWSGGSWGVWIGLLAASVIFGACHWITPTYAVLATGIGVYLGWLFLATDHLVAPIVAHALYDFVALVYLVRTRSSRPHAVQSDDGERSSTQ